MSAEVKYVLRLQTISHLIGPLTECILGKGTNELQLPLVCPSLSHNPTIAHLPLTSAPSLLLLRPLLRFVD